LQHDVIVTKSTDLTRARALARLLDAAVGIPGTPLRIGMDAVLGLIPGAGDMVAAALGGYIVLAAVRNGAPRAVVVRMLGNIGIDALLGSIPVIGDIFDVAYKSNIRNAELLERYALEPGRVVAATRRQQIVVVAALVLLVMAAGLLTYLFFRLIWRAFAGLG